MNCRLLRSDVAVAQRQHRTRKHLLDPSECRCWRRRRLCCIRYTCGWCSSRYRWPDIPDERFVSSKTLENQTITCLSCLKKLLGSLSVFAFTSLLSCLHLRRILLIPTTPTHQSRNTHYNLRSTKTMFDTRLLSILAATGFCRFAIFLSRSSTQHQFCTLGATAGTDRKRLCAYSMQTLAVRRVDQYSATGLRLKMSMNARKRQKLETNLDSAKLWSRTWRTGPMGLRRTIQKS